MTIDFERRSAACPTTRQRTRAFPRRTLFRADCSVRSLLKELKESPRSNHVDSHGLSPPTQLAIRRDECDHLIRGVRGGVNEHVVTAGSGVEHRDAVGDASLSALAGLAFQNHDDRWGDPSRVNGRPYLVDERSGGSSPVSPPAGWSRPDHVCCINEKHRSSLIVTANGGGAVLPSDHTCAFERGSLSK